MISSLLQSPFSTTGWKAIGCAISVNRVGTRGPALLVDFVLNRFAVDVLCMNVFRTPLLINTLRLVGTPSWSKARLEIESVIGSSTRAIALQAAGLPSRFAYMDFPISTHMALSMFCM